MLEKPINISYIISKWSILFNTSNGCDEPPSTTENLPLSNKFEAGVGQIELRVIVCFDATD